MSSRTIKFSSTEEYGELEGFFDEKDNLIHTWNNNDACWRGEYLDPLLEHFGITVEYPQSRKLEKKLIKHWKAIC